MIVTAHKNVGKNITVIIVSHCADRIQKGFTEVTVPGERAGKERVRRLADGIPIDNITLEQLRTLATELDISC